MVAGLGSMEFSGLTAIASAFYVNFDSPQVKRLPELIREQRSSVEDSLEWTVAHVVAHQWWGSAVGSDPQRRLSLTRRCQTIPRFSIMKMYIAKRVRLLPSTISFVAYTRSIAPSVAKICPRTNRHANTIIFFQYSAIVASKGALMFAELRRLLGDQRFFSA